MRAKETEMEGFEEGAGPSHRQRTIGELFADRLTRGQFVRRAGGILFVTGAGSVLAACGGDDDEGAGAQQTGTGAAPAATEEAVTTGGDLKVGIVGFPVAWDSAFATQTALYLLKNVLDPLVRLGEDLSAQPALATTWESPDGGKTWEFELVETTWHDGKPFSSADVKAHFERILDPETGSPGQQVYEIVESIDATEPTRVRFNLKSVDAEFPLLLGLYQGNIQPAHGDPTKFGTEPMVGTGPFKWGQVVPAQSLELVRNEDYFAEGEPVLDSLTFVSFEDHSARLNALTSKEIDVAPDLPKDLVKELEGNEDVPVSESIPGTMHTVYLRADQEPGNDPRVVKAFKMSVDREGLVEAALRGYGTATGDNPIPPGSPAYVEVPMPARDVEGARALLAEAGFADGVDLELFVPGGTPGAQELALGVQSMAGEAGFRIKINTIPADVFYADYWLKQNFGITDWGPRPTLDAQFRIAYTCEGVWNESHWCDESFDQLLDEARTTADDAQRAELQKQIQEYFAENGNTLIPYHFPIIAGHLSSVQNLQEHPILLYTDFRRVSKQA
jgi:peptide/nickel transport system substrate-binding protein